MQRDTEIKNFKSDQFWFLDLSFVQKQEKGEDLEATFTWDRSRMFDQAQCKQIYDTVLKALKNNEATVSSVKMKETQKLKPIPLNTVEATKLISSKLKISPEVAMAVMEKLYN